MGSLQRESSGDRIPRAARVDRIHRPLRAERGPEQTDAAVAIAPLAAPERGPDHHGASPARVLLLAAAALALSGCVGSLFGGGGSFGSHFQSGRYEQAIAAFERDSSLHRRESALYRVGLLRADRGEPYYDPARSRELLRRLLELHPETRHRWAAESVLALLRGVGTLEARLARLEDRLEVSRSRAERLRSELEEAGSRARVLRDSLSRALARSARLEDQLEKLRKVHLGQVPDTGQANPR